MTTFEEADVREITPEFLQEVFDCLKKKEVTKIGARNEEDMKTCVSLRCSTLNDDQVVELGMMIGKSPGLCHIDLSETRISPKGALQAIQSSSFFTESVQHIAFRHCNLSPTIITALIDPIERTKLLFSLGPILELDLSHNCIDDNAAVALAAALPSAQNLVSLDLSENHLTEVGQQALEKALALHPSLKSVRYNTAWKPQQMRICGNTCIVS